VAAGIKEAFSNMTHSIINSTLERFGVFDELNNATETFKKGLDLQIKGVDKMVASTANLQANLAEDLTLFQAMSDVVNKVADSFDNINVHANNLSRSALNDFLEDTGATNEEKKITNALYDVDDAANKQRQAVQTRNRKLQMVDAQINKAQTDAEMQEDLIRKLEQKVKSVIMAEKLVAQDGDKISDVSFEDYAATSGDIFSFLGGILKWHIEGKEHKQYK
jgi:hypothetical protein